MHILRVFTDEQGNYGNPVGIITDTTRKLNHKTRQQMTKESGYSEIVFIDDFITNSISIFSPKRQISFAGHAAVGTAYFLAQKINRPVTKLMCLNNQIETWTENGLTWVKSDLKFLPSWQFESLAGADEVKTLTPNQIKKYQHTFVWAWLDKERGVVRARTLAPDWGIPEDEANGSGSMLLATTLNRKLEIHHGQGSIIYAQPSGPGFAAVAGRVKLVS